MPWGGSTESSLWGPEAYLRSTLEVHSGHGQRSDVHSDAAIQVQRSDDEEESAAHYGPKGKTGMGETGLPVVRLVIFILLGAGQGRQGLTLV